MAYQPDPPTPAEIAEIRALLDHAAVLLTPPRPARLAEAERKLAEAHALLERLMEPPDPYKDMNLRPGLNQTQTIGEAAARGMIAPPADTGERFSYPPQPPDPGAKWPEPPKEASDA